MNDDLWRTLRLFALLSGAGIYFAVILGICVYCGMLWDDFFSAGNKGKLAGILLGFPIGVFSLYRQIKKIQRDQ